MHIANETNEQGELVNAIQYAETIFYNEMKKQGVDVSYLSAKLRWGERGEFVNDELCKVNVVYDSEAQYNVYYPHIIQQTPTIYPLALSLQSKGGVTENVWCMDIDLNPDVSFYYGVDANPGIGEFDMVTVLLRALVIGCGFQSTLNVTDRSVGYQSEDITYMNIFDNYVQNSEGNLLWEVGMGNLTIEQFLRNNCVDMGGVALYNDWELGEMTDLSVKTLNTVSNDIYSSAEIDSGFIDLMDPFLPMSVAIHELTKYTLYALQKIGWQWDVPVGEINESQKILYESDIKGSKVLFPNKNYRFYLDGNASASSFKCELFTEDTTSYVVAVSDISMLDVKYDALPVKTRWKRNPITKNIVGRVTCEASVLGDNGGVIRQVKTFPIEVPYVPDIPVVKQTESISDGMIQLKLQAFANGSDYYVVQYKGYHDLLPHVDTLMSDAVTKIYDDIPATQVYRLYVSGVNSVGEGESYSLLFGVSSEVELRMRTLCDGQSLLYSFYYGDDEITDIEIERVEIISRTGLQTYPVKTPPGEFINIRFLLPVRGVYILRVTLADGRQFSETFMRR